MKNVYKYEFKANFKKTIIWLICLTGVNWIFLSLYQGSLQDINDFKALLSGYPPEALKAMQFDFVGVFSFSNYYSSVLLYLNLCLGIQASVLAFSLFTKELKLKLSDYLYSKPVSRSNILLQKYLAGLTLLIIEFVFLFLFNVLLLKNSRTEVDFILFFNINFSMLMVMLSFFSLSFLFACLANKWINPSIKNIRSRPI